MPMVNFFTSLFELQNGLLCNGEFFHIRCCAHILNLIVQEGLKVSSGALYKIRESIKYVKASEGWLKQFKRCIQEMYLDDMGSFLRLDVSIKWNATCMMLESAIKYRCAFTSLTYNDRNYKYCPSNEEWERAEKICAFLDPFYQITNLIFGSSYPTSNLYFMQVYTIEMKLNQNLNSEDEVIKDMVTRMKVKFDKYWSDYCIVLALGCVLDPRTKLKFLSFCYKRMYPNNYQEKVDRVKNALYTLFSEYLKSGTSNSIDSHDMSHMTQSSPHGPMTMGGNETSSLPSIYEEFEEEMSQEVRNNDKSQLDTYLEAKIVGNDKDFDVLQYWKMNKYRFPDLAIMACDILSIPITTVASESIFSIGGRILTKYRSCLLSKNVQDLICTRNWVHGFEEIEPSDADGSVLDDITLSDSNIIPDEDDFINSYFSICSEIIVWNATCELIVEEQDFSYSGSNIA